MSSCVGVSALVVVSVWVLAQTSFIPLAQPADSLSQMNTMLAQGAATQAGLPKAKVASQMVVPCGVAKVVSSVSDRTQLCVKQEKISANGKVQISQHGTGCQDTAIWPKFFSVPHTCMLGPVSARHYNGVYFTRGTAKKASGARG